MEFVVPLLEKKIVFDDNYYIKWIVNYAGTSLFVLTICLLFSTICYCNLLA